MRYVVSKGGLPEFLEWSLALCAAAKLDVDKLLTVVASRQRGAPAKASVGSEERHRPHTGARQRGTAEGWLSSCVDTSCAEDRVTTFSDAVKGAIERARAERDEQKERATKGLTRIRLADEDGVPIYYEYQRELVFDLARRPRLARRELKRFLLSLPVTYVYTLAALARVGRDGLRTASVERQFDAVRSACARPQEALDGMLGRRRLARDLEAALTELANAGIAVDSLV